MGVCVHVHTQTPLHTSAGTKKRYRKVAEYKANCFPAGQQQTAGIWNLKYSNIDSSTYRIKHFSINLTDYIQDIRKNHKTLVTKKKKNQRSKETVIPWAWTQRLCLSRWGFCRFICALDTIPPEVPAAYFTVNWFCSEVCTEKSTCCWMG